MNRVFRFEPRLRAEAASREQIFALRDREKGMLQGRRFGLLALLMDGRRTVQDLLDELEGVAARHEILYTLMRLESTGYIAEAEKTERGDGLWGTLQSDAARLAATPITIEGIGGEDTAPLQEALVLAGVRVGRAASIRILVTSDYLAPEIEAENRRALLDGTHWMLVKPAGPSAWIGPMFHPGVGPCWMCLAHRLRINRLVQTLIEQHRDRERSSGLRLAVGARARTAVDLAALYIARWITERETSALGDRLLDLDLIGFKTSEHVVMRRPECTVCGDPSLMKSRPLRPVLQGRPKRFTSDGGHRGVSPEETFARYEHLISPITGVIASLEPVKGRDTTLQPVYQAAFPVWPSSTDPIGDEFLYASAGKGRTHAQARTSALCEAVERLSAVSQGNEPKIRARLSDFGDEGVHPSDLLHFSDAQFDARDAINTAVRDPRHAVPLRYDERGFIDWAPAWSMTASRRRYLPMTYCYSHLSVTPEESVCHFNPNGHAVGNSFEEAFLQGFLELVERDAVAVWWANRIERQSVDLQSFEDPYFVSLKDYYRSLGWLLWVLDLTHDLGIPVFAALARRPKDGRFFAGYGCHFDARVGVSRALTELNQVWSPERPGRAPWDEHSVGDAAYLFPSERLPLRARKDFPAIVHDDLRDDVRECVERASSVGLETIVLDQTRPDFHLSAVKVVVPGLRHFWPRFGPGRLYDVPVRLGWRNRPLLEVELNRVPIVS